MTRFLLLRHGETEWNREMIFRGRKEIPLSEEGREQARRLAAALGNEPIAKIYSSPLSRAAETAEILRAGRGLEMHLREELIDMNFGEWEGLSVVEAEARYPKEYRLWQEQPEDFLPPGGEGLRAIRTRASSLLQELSGRHAGETIALVTHRVVCKMLLCEALGLDDSAFWKIQQDLCALNLFTAEEGKYVVQRMNDTCHLRQLGGVVVDF